MKKSFLILALLLIASCAQAKINLEVAIMRNNVMNMSEVIQLECTKDPIKVYQDDLTYIEVELISEQNDTVLVGFIVATKGENNSYMVRGMPRLTLSLKKNLCMGSLNCDGRGEHFILIAAASKA